jgi:hypothetical protein
MTAYAVIRKYSESNKIVRPVIIELHLNPIDAITSAENLNALRANAGYTDIVYFYKEYLLVEQYVNGIESKR